MDSREDLQSSRTQACVATQIKTSKEEAAPEGPKEGLPLRCLFIGLDADVVVRKVEGLEIVLGELDSRRELL